MYEETYGRKYESFWARYASQLAIIALVLVGIAIFMIDSRVFPVCHCDDPTPIALVEVASVTTTPVAQPTNTPMLTATPTEEPTMAPTATPEPTSTPTPTPTQEVIPEYPEWVGEYGGVQWTRYQLYPQNRAVVIEGTYYQAVPGGYDLQAEGTNGIYLFFVEAPEVCPLTKFETIGPHLNNIGTDVVTRFGYVPSGDPDFGPTLYVDPGGSNNWACGWDMVLPVIKTATPTPTNTVTMEPTTPPVVMSTPVPAVTAIPTPDWASYDEWPANYEVGWVIPEEWVIGQDENGYVLLLSGTYYYPDTVNPTQPQPIGVGRTFVFHEDVSTTCNYPLFETVGNFLASTEGQVMIVPFNQPYFHEVAFGFAGSDWNCGWQKWNNN